MIYTAAILRLVAFPACSTPNKALIAIGLSVVLWF